MDVGLEKNPSFSNKPNTEISQPKVPTLTDEISRINSRTRLETKPGERGEASLLSDYELNEKLKEINRILYGNENGPSGRAAHQHYFSGAKNFSREMGTSPTNAQFRSFDRPDSQRGRNLFGAKSSDGFENRPKSENRLRMLPEDSDWWSNTGNVRTLQANK